MAEMKTVSGPTNKYDPMVTVKKTAVEGVAVTGAGALAYAATGAIVTAIPATAPFAPYMIGGLTILFAAINRFFWNWRKNKDKGK